MASTSLSAPAGPSGADERLVSQLADPGSRELVLGGSLYFAALRALLLARRGEIAKEDIANEIVWELESIAADLIKEACNINVVEFENIKYDIKILINKFIIDLFRNIRKNAIINLGDLLDEAYRYGRMIMGSRVVPLFDVLVGAAWLDEEVLRDQHEALVGLVREKVCG